jgi:hypothetical protein
VGVAENPAAQNRTQVRTRPAQACTQVRTRLREARMQMDLATQGQGLAPQQSRVRKNNLTYQHIYVLSWDDRKRPASLGRFQAAPTAQPMTWPPPVRTPPSRRESMSAP